MAKNFNLRLIKTRESYPTKKLAGELGVHPRTIQEWVKEGLKPVGNEKPYLFMGYEVVEFLEKRIKNRKCKLEKDEFYCTKCRKAVRSTDNDVWIDVSGHTIGKNGFKSMIIKGVCDLCNSRINRFSHTGKLEEVKKIFDVIEIGEKANV